MSDENRLVPAEGTVLPELSPAEELARKIIAALDVIGEHIPNLQTPHPDTARKVRGARTVTRDVVVSMIAAAEAAPKLRDMGPFDPDRAREVLQSADALKVVAEHLALLLTKVNYTIEAEWAQVASAAMRTYTVASIMAQEPEHAELAAHLAPVRRHLGRKNAGTGKKRARHDSR